MKIFAVYARVNLTKQPDWLNDFRKKYGKLYDPHITLKQPCFADEEQIESIKEKLNQFFPIPSFSGHRINIIFNKKVIDNKIEGEACIMIHTDNKEICDLQSKIKLLLSEYRNYYEAKREEYENNFKPHITIASELDSETLLKADSEIGDDLVCEGIVEEVVLVVAKEKTAEEVSDPKNLTAYHI